MINFQVKFCEINADFDPQYEKDWGFLERSYENTKYIHEAVFESDTPILEFRYKDDISFDLKDIIDSLPNSITLNNVCVLDIIGETNNSSYFIVSKSLLSSTSQIQPTERSKGYFYFYLLADIEYTKIFPNVYITNAEIPEKLTSIL